MKNKSKISLIAPVIVIATIIGLIGIRLVIGHLAESKPVAQFSPPSKNTLQKRLPNFFKSDIRDTPQNLNNANNSDEKMPPVKGQPSGLKNRNAANRNQGQRRAIKRPKGQSYRRVNQEENRPDIERSYGNNNGYQRRPNAYGHEIRDRFPPPPPMPPDLDLTPEEERALREQIERARERYYNSPNGPPPGYYPPPGYGMPEDEEPPYPPNFEDDEYNYEGKNSPRKEKNLKTSDYNDDYAIKAYRTNDPYNRAYEDEYLYEDYYYEYNY